MIGIGCAGELEVQEHEDYDKWRIDIRVKFRDGEKLQLLTAQRQSGGVRFNDLRAYCYIVNAKYSAGTFSDHNLVPDEYDGTGPCTVLSGRRDQPGMYTTNMCRG